MTRQRNYTLDVLKLIAAYMVMLIHSLFYGKIGYVVDTAARFAVPLFFVISGFYACDITLKQIKKRIIHILRLLVLAIIVYTLWNVLPLLIQQDTQGLTQYFSQYLSIDSLLELLVFNVSLSSTHLWYLLAILYVFIIYYFIVLFNVPKKFVFAASIALLAIHLLLGEGLSIFGIFVPIPFVRNFALMGIPFFGLGLLANTYKHKLLNIQNYIIVGFLIIGFLEPVFSRYLFGKNELYVGSLCVLLACTVIFIKFPNIKYPSALLSLTSCSTYIYIFHSLVSKGFLKLYSILHTGLDSSVFLRMIHPLIVCVVSTSLAYLLNKITNRLKA